MNLYRSDCLSVLKNMESDSIDSIVTDPPYGIGILGEKWDKSLPAAEIWQECFRVLKPGGYILAFSSARTYHHLAMSMEKAGFETQNMLAWLYGNGHPKGANLALQFDKADGVPVPDDEFRAYLRNAIRRSPYKIRELEELCGTHGMFSHYLGRVQAAFPTLEKWRILKRVLKLDDRYDQIFEKIEVKRAEFRSKKEVREGGAYMKGIAKNFERHIPKSDLAKKWNGYRYGKNALRPAIEPIYFGQKPPLKPVTKNIEHYGLGALNIDKCKVANQRGEVKYPSNVMHDGSEVVRDALNSESKRASLSLSEFRDNPLTPFFYVPKPGKSERGEFNNHPTVKPLSLMRHLVRLVTPKGGTVCDPFMGSGTTGMATLLEGAEFIGVEKNGEYFNIAKRRLNQARRTHEMCKNLFFRCLSFSSRECERTSRRRGELCTNSVSHPPGE